MKKYRRKSEVVEADLLSNGSYNVKDSSGTYWEYAPSRFHQLYEPVKEENLPTIVCLCGSARFKDEFTKAELEETLAGNIVLTIGCSSKPDTEIFGHLSESEFAETKHKLDGLHFRKIEMSDVVCILNVGGYMGESTRNELEHARKLGKTIRFLEPE
jgi:hypothetical protein